MPWEYTSDRWEFRPRANEPYPYEPYPTEPAQPNPSEDFKPGDRVVFIATDEDTLYRCADECTGDIGNWRHYFQRDTTPRTLDYVTQRGVIVKLNHPTDEAALVFYPNAKWKVPRWAIKKYIPAPYTTNTLGDFPTKDGAPPRLPLAQVEPVVEAQVEHHSTWY